MTNTSNFARRTTKAQPAFDITRENISFRNSASTTKDSERHFETGKMTSDRLKNVTDDHPLLKRIITPFYTVRLIILSLWICSISYSIAWVANRRNDDTVLNLEYGTEAAFVIIATLTAFLVATTACWILDVVTVVKRMRRTLSHRFFLIVNVIQTAIWTLIFVLMMLGSRTVIDFIVGIGIYITFVGVLIYASIAYHRLRVASKYQSVIYDDNTRQSYFGGQTDAQKHLSTQSEQEMGNMRFESYRPYQGADGIHEVGGDVQRPDPAAGTLMHQCR